MNKNLKIIFLGTPEFAVGSLKALIEKGYQVAAVVTAPDQPAGRGLELKMSPVKKLASDKNLKVLQPVKLKDPSFLDEIKKIGPDLMIVVAFRMMPKELWQIPPLGTFNLHASLLPQYRGAAPINRAIMNGESVTGVTTFFLQQEIDTGNIILSEKVLIAENETAGELHDKLMDIGASLVVKTVRLIEKGSVTTISQNELLQAEIKTAPKIFKSDCKINWNQTADTINNLVRGLHPFPGAFTELVSPTNELFPLKIHKVLTEKTSGPEQCGLITTDGKSYLKISCTDGFIQLKEVQLAGKKKMLLEELLRGFRVDNSWKIKTS